MLVIRAPQMQALSAHLRRQFSAQMRAHLREHFPSQTSAMSEPRLEAFVDKAIERARTHGLTSKRDVCLYLNVSMTLGASFEEAPSTAWAGEFLSDPDVPAPSERISRLHAEVVRRAELEERNRRLREEFSHGG